MVVINDLTIIQVRNDLYCFTDVSWRKIHQQGKIPSPRESQLAIGYLNRWIFLYGGCINSTILEDMYLFDTEKNTWSEITRFMGRLPLRTDASICIMKNDIVIFGGRDRKKKYTNDMFRLRVEWQSEQKDIKTATIVIEKVEFSNRGPLERSGHVAVSYNDRYMFVIGG